ncbi:hypothetical protein JYU14_03345 [Simkania negevensis]|uniref:Uncharacterized protein n=1 Tax=Simkania negevensis TaxID=83561 RepID=A0ABS3ARE4_9BACT|nr:hypothetical protein [Simkania negevensis]
MINPIEIEASFQEYIQDLTRWAPDGIIQVDLDLLQSLGLLDCGNEEMVDDSEEMDFQFHVIESSEKITLFNEEFVIWIVPEVKENASSTFILVALNCEGSPQLELVFVTSGVYNTSRFVLQLLEHYLREIVENEDTLERISVKDK